MLHMLSSQSYIVTDGRSISKSWCRTPSGAHDQIFISLTVTVLFLWSALSDERTGLSFVYADGPRQRSLSRVGGPWVLPPYFTVSVSRLPFSSPPTTCRVMVEVFDPASTQLCTCYNLPNFTEFQPPATAFSTLILGTKVSCSFFFIVSWLWTLQRHHPHPGYLSCLHHPSSASDLTIRLIILLKGSCC
jgi:hypothetical protein